jgi:DNA-binding NtrC family response regulator
MVGLREESLRQPSGAASGSFRRGNPRSFGETAVRAGSLTNTLGTIVPPGSWRYMAYILIVDSQAEFRQQLVRLLEQAGNRATAVASVSEAAKLLQAEVPDLLATDVVLIDGSSTTLVQQAQAAGARTLIMTGNPDRIVEFEGARQPYLSKPFRAEAFLQRVDEILAAKASGANA